MNNNLMPCGLEDDRIRFPPDAPEDDDPRSDAEKRLEWLCDEWADAQADDHYDTWRDVRMMVHGAIQALNYCKADARHDDRMALMAAGSLAFEYSLDCIQQGKYEGASK